MRTSLSLCTWNIEFGKKITEIIKLMATDSHFQNLDFLVLQEASIHNGTEDAKIIADILGPEYDYFQVTAHKLRGCVQANAFIWNKNALTVKGKEAIPLPQWKETSGLPRREKVFLRLLPKQLRNSLVVEATFKKFSIRIYAAHLDVLGNMRKTGQFTAILKDSQQRDPVDLAIILGDMNTYRLRKQKFGKVLAQLATEQGFIDVTSALPFTFFLRRLKIRQKLDAIFVKTVLPIDFKSWTLDVSGSDHLPVFARIDF